MDWRSYNFFMVIDLEATCCDRQSIPRHQMETIEIGAVMVDRATLQPVSEFQTFVRPVRHPQLTDFCRDLTTITQADVDAAPQFAQVIGLFQTWLAQYPNYLFCSWGEFDLRQIQKEVRYHKLDWSIHSSHCNLKSHFSKSYRKQLQSMNGENHPKPYKTYGLTQALQLVGRAIEGTPHRGIDDARNAAKLIPYAFGIATR